MSERDGRTIAPPSKFRLHILKRFAIWEWAIAFSIIFFLVDEFSELHRGIDPEAIVFAYLALYLFTITQVSFPKSIAWIELSAENTLKINSLVKRRYKDLLFYLVYSLILNLKYLILLYLLFKFTIPTLNFLNLLHSYWSIETKGLLHFFTHILTTCLTFMVIAIAIQIIVFLSKGAVLKPLHFIMSSLDRLSKRADERQEL